MSINAVRTTEEEAMIRFLSGACASAALSVGLLSAPAGAQTFTWAFPAEVPTLDPNGSGVVTAQTLYLLTYERLSRLVPGKGAEPELAESWTQVEPTRWRFKLRSGIKFHDGQALTADDVVFSLDRGRSEGSDLRDYLRLVREVVKVDDLTVDVVSSEPIQILPVFLASFPIMSKAWAVAHKAEKPTRAMDAGEQSYANFNANGTGPFKLISRKVDERTEFAVNEGYWRPVEHNFKKLVFRPIKDPGTRVAALVAGEVDFIDGVPVQDVERLGQDRNLTVTTTPEWRGIFLGLDMAKDTLAGSNVTDKNPFKDVRVRRAVAQAIDVQAIHSRVMRGLSDPGGLVVGPGITGYAKEIDGRLPYDPEAAKKLLADAGYPQGFSVALDCSNDRYMNDQQVCLAIVSMLARVGIKVDLSAQPASLFFPKVFQKKSGFYMFGWVTTIGDASQPLTSLIHSKGRFNFGGYANAQVDALIDEANRSPDGPGRVGLLQQALVLNKDEIGMIPLHRQVIVWAHRKTIKVAPRPDNILPIASFRAE